MEEQVERVLRELERFGREHDAAETERSRKMLNLDRETAALVSMLARGSQARSALEIGTSNGYSTIWLAWSVRNSGGRVTTLDRRAEKQAMARENLVRARLAEVVDFQLGDATELVGRLPGPYDFVFFDADRVTAPQQLKLLLPKLADRVFLLADNALSHPAEIAGYLAAVEALPDFTHVVVPVGKGLSVAFRG
jgi:predicted O-methyltransferase YrrM